MLSIIEQLKLGKLWDFPGGIHPPEQKKLSNQSPVSAAFLPDELVIPLKQHLGAVGSLSVAVGDKVLKGQALTHTDVALSVPVHAPTSGVIAAIEARTIAHPSGLSDRCIILKPDGKDSWGTKNTITNYLESEPADLIEHIRSCGISGMGGAGFPTARKLQSASGKTDLLIINAAECEPYITADDRLMQDYADEIVEGIRIISYILKPKMTVIGIEDNKPEAIAALTQSVKEQDNILIRVIPTKYPSGGEKQLIKILTGREVPTQGIPADIGIMMQNIGTAHAIKKAVIDGEPLIQRVVTITGQTVSTPCNTWALLGTPVQALLNRYGYKIDKKQPRVIMGGPMMGFTLPHTEVPITKTANCILAPSRKELSAPGDEMSCIRCTACAEACPVSLLPQQLQWYAKDGDYDKCEEYNLFDCIECGACAYVCPSEIPLVHYYRQAKAEIRHRKQDALSAERAKQRFEAKNVRMEREKEEREQRFQKAAEQRRKDMAAKGGDDAVAAAIARVKAKKEADAGTEVKPAVAAAIAKAKAKQAEAQAKAQSAAPGDTALPDNSEMAKLREERKRQAREQKAAKAAAEADAPVAAPEAEAARPSEGDPKKAAVAAAIARAKARKTAQAAESQAEPQTDKPAEAAPDEQATADTQADPKKAAVAAAIARAKARKAAQAAESQPDKPADAVAEEQAITDAQADPKKAAVAAAIARAKARKAAQAAESQADKPAEAAPDEQATTDAQADPKKAAVAAAIARAKARKAAQAAESQADKPAEAAPDEQATTDAQADPKKAAVAAAIARAKARKAAQAAEKEAAEKSADNNNKPNEENK